MTAALIRCLSPWGGLNHILEGSDTVLIKLNLLSAEPPSAAVTTHPSVVEAVTTIVKDAGAIPILGDSPGGFTTQASFHRLLEVTGIAAVADTCGCEVVCFDTLPMKEYIGKGRTYRKFTIPSLITEVDAVICLPKFKTHQLTGITGAVKLLYGYLPGKAKAEYHLIAGKDLTTFSEFLCDLYATFPPSFSIMDAVDVMEGNGPHHGIPRHLGLLLASQSGPALDLTMASIVGFNVKTLPTIEIAAQREMGPGSINEIEILGPCLDELRVSDFCPPTTHRSLSLPTFITTGAKWLFAARPCFDSVRCRKCGLCANHCPANAIHHTPGALPSISHTHCIRCYCCEELCPAGAVEIKAPLLRRWLG